ncbi:DnaK protein [Nitzschia inconspicua]|uniref:DnaK protein n=1 Tax=Nitzschia inconspicua TaxID=303405 RepID=A0A9K3PEI4_9STRA|nr:DnaK protein [Nitzschia inconspicua]
MISRFGNHLRTHIHRPSTGRAPAAFKSWSCCLPSNPLDNNNSKDHENRASPSIFRRHYHATSRQEILPLVAGLGVIFVGRYSWKALKRMDQEWEDYLWELQRYQRQRLKHANASEIPITIGVDVGSFYLKLSRMNGNKPELIETPQGDRYRFNGIMIQEGGDIVTGKTALDKFYYPLTEDTKDSATDSSSSNSVILPYMELHRNSHSDAASLVQNVFVPAVSEAMERVASDMSSNNKDDGKSSKTLRTVLALPPLFYNRYGESFFRNFQDDSHHTITVPEPVAAIWGAQELGIIPTPQSKEENSSSSLVIDIGGLATTISLVQEDKVIYYVNLHDVGGESFVQQLVNRILNETGDTTMSKDPMSLTLIQSSARSSVMELVNKTQSNVHIPYLYMGRKPDNPHLDTTISRTALEQAVQDFWKSETVPKLLDDGVLSTSLPPPTGAPAIFTSAITKVLEESNVVPTNIETILVVGGGSKHRLFEEACKEAIFALIGPVANSQKLVLPESSLRSELTALGAASLLPNFDYDFDKGLENISG